MSKVWSDFYNYMLPDLPGAETSLVDFALRQAAIAFCEKTMAWRYDHPNVTITSGTAFYSFTAPTDATIHAVTYAKFGDTEIDCKSGESILAAKISDWRDATGTPQFILGGATSFQLIPEPDADGTLTMKVALKPSVTAATLDTNIFNEYREAIVHGALARLMYSPKKPYTNPALAQYHGQQFEIMAGQAGMRQDRNYTRSPLQTSIRRRG